MKIRQRIIPVMTLVFILAASTAMCDSGEQVFAQKCLGCHKIGGSAPPIQPADKAASVWNRYFKRNRHEINLSEHLSAAELKSVKQFLMSNAADAEKPLTAVIPK